jgi:hypothetical protein
MLKKMMRWMKKEEKKNVNEEEAMQPGDRRTFHT